VKCVRMCWAADPPRFDVVAVCVIGFGKFIDEQLRRAWVGRVGEVGKVPRRPGIPCPTDERSDRRTNERAVFFSQLRDLPCYVMPSAVITFFFLTFYNNALCTHPRHFMGNLTFPYHILSY